MHTQVLSELRQLRILIAKPAARLVPASDAAPSEASDHPDPSPFHKDTVTWDSVGGGWRCRLCSSGEDAKWATEGHFAGREHQKKMKEAGY